MNLTENIKEGLRSVQGNALRTVLTALIIAIGIMSLVGILTAIEGIRASVNSSFSSLGANAFDIQSTRPWRRARAGVNEKVYPPMEYRQATRFKKMFEYPADITLLHGVSGTAEVKYKSKKTNPNARVMGCDENYLSIKDYKLESGRGFSQNELERAAWVVIIGQEIKTTLFDRLDPLNQYISVLGGRYKVVGVLEKQGGMMGSSADRMIMLPVETARRVAGGQDLTYDITVAVKDPTQLETIMGEATGLMRLIRRDAPGQPESFEIKASESLASRLDNIASYLRIGGGVVGFITLLGRLHRPHEHHDGIGDRTHAGNRHPQGFGRHAPAHPPAVSHRGHRDLPAGRHCGRHLRIAGRQPAVFPHQFGRLRGALALDRGRPGGVRGGGAALGLLPGVPGLPARPHRVAAF
jgi:putative ABC transport system permease protein